MLVRLGAQIDFHFVSMFLSVLSLAILILYHRLSSIVPFITHASFTMNFTTLILLFYLFGLTLATKCYFPNGAKAPDSYKPCGSHCTIFNTCCDRENLNLACLKNGLCAETRDTTVRGACTDKDWSGCQELCPMSEGTIVRASRDETNHHLRAKSHIGPCKEVQRRQILLLRVQHL